MAFKRKPKNTFLNDKYVSVGETVMMVIYKLELFNYETRNATSIPRLKSSHLKLYNV